MLKKYCTDLGLLILRLGIGIMFVLHGTPKITGGIELWTKLGSSMGNLGIDFVPPFWGFMAALSEFGGAILLILGVGFRLASFLMLTTMCVATAHHFGKGDGIQGASHALEAGILFLSLFFTGPGKYTLRYKQKENAKK